MYSLKRNEIVSLLLWLILAFTIGLGYREELVLLFASTLLLCLILYGLIVGKKLIFPALLGSYGLFLAVFLITCGWSRDLLQSMQYWLLYASVPVVWVLAFNYRKQTKRWFFPVLLALGLLYAGMTVVTQTSLTWSYLKTTPRGLVGAYASNADHFMLGDYWGVLLTVLVYRYFLTKKEWLLPLIGVGLAILLFSLSRSALLGFVVALIYLFEKMPTIDKKWKRGFWAVLVLAILYMGTQKSILFNRPYYMQVVAALPTYPWGIGFGNFEHISQDSRFWILGLSGFSRVTHSILLEFMAGMGILAAVWWGWLVVFYRRYLKNVGVNEYSLAMIALMVDFLFNPTYLVTAMVWLWAILLGILGERAEAKWQSMAGVGFGLTCLALVGIGLWVVRV